MTFLPPQEITNNSEGINNKDNDSEAEVNIWVFRIASHNNITMIIITAVEAVRLTDTVCFHVSEHRHQVGDLLNCLRSSNSGTAFATVIGVIAFRTLQLRT